MGKKILITGITGFAGSFLAEYLALEKSDTIYGTYLTEDSVKNISNIKDAVTLFQVDLVDSDSVSHLVKTIRPDFVFHLAALPSPSDSFRNPVKTVINNITAEINLLEAIKNENLQSTKILIISSADIYGSLSKEDLPMDEKTTLAPNNPYAVSKLTQDFLGLQYFLSYNLSVIRVRPFNHIGPRQAPSFAVASFAKRIAEIEKGKENQILRVGNLNTKRDFTDVRDMVKAYVLAIEKGKIGDVYNIGSGVSHSMKKILDILLSFTNKKIKVVVDGKLLRPTDVLELRCDSKKFQKETGWKQQISLQKTLKDTLDYWRNIV